MEDVPPDQPTPPPASGAPERRDADGLPLDREATIDDVRGGENHFKLAVGCSAVTVLLIAAFWVLRLLLSR